MYVGARAVASGVMAVCYCCYSCGWANAMPIVDVYNVSYYVLYFVSTQHVIPINHLLVMQFLSSRVFLQRKR